MNQVRQISEDWQRLIALTIDAVRSPSTKRAYETALYHFWDWHHLQQRVGFTKATVCAYRCKLEAAGLAPSSINVHLSALRKLAREAVDNGLLTTDFSISLSKIKYVKRLGVRAGNWLSKEKAQVLLLAPDAGTLKGKRDRAILAVCLGCALRRSEIAALRVEQIQQRDGRWVIVDVIGQCNRIRTVPVPLWVKVALDAWTEAAAIESGFVFRPVNRGDRVWGERLTARVVWQMLQKYADQCGIPHLAPSDLRRTCAKLCRASGGELEQIQLLLGHESLETTARSLGLRQDLVYPPNDRIMLNSSGPVSGPSYGPVSGPVSSNVRQFGQSVSIESKAADVTDVEGNAVESDGGAGGNRTHE